jgi:hypothetical protein
MNTLHYSDIFYKIKPLIPRELQLFLRRNIVKYKRSKYRHIWPINTVAGQKPVNWTGWPNKKKFAFILTHDVDTLRGQARCKQLMDLENNYGFRSSFNFVPERYEVSSDLRGVLKDEGFEVGVHGLVHDGKLYCSPEIFNSRAKRINHYLKNWGATGFRSPVMQRNLKWICKLNIDYDASTFDTDPFEPQSDGVNTIFPFWVNGSSEKRGYIELPYTLPQDFTLFILMKEKTIDIWKTKLDWVVENEGMALVNVHPDYMNFESKKCKREEYPAENYRNFLDYVTHKYEGQYWHVLPRDIAQLWANRVIKCE